MQLRLIPSRASVWTLAAIGLASAIALVMGTPLASVTRVAEILATLLFAYALIDVFWSALAWRRAPLQWQRQLPAAFAIGVPRTLAGTLVNNGELGWRVALFDRVDPSFDVEGLPQTLAVPAKAPFV